jgi:hypothetical protein
MISLLIILLLKISKKNQLRNIKVNSNPSGSCADAPTENFEGCKTAYNALVSLLESAPGPGPGPGPGQERRKNKILKDSIDHQYQKLKRKATDQDLLDAALEFANKCPATKCRTGDGSDGCAGVFATALTLADINNELVDFIDECDPKNTPEVEPPTPVPEETSEEIDTNSETSTPGQAPGRGYQRWNSKEIKLLMILTNLIGLLYFIR